MDRKQRSAIAKSAVLEAEVSEVLAEREWKVVVDGDRAMFEMPDESAQPVENVIAGLLVRLNRGGR